MSLKASTMGSIRLTFRLIYYNLHQYAIETPCLQMLIG